MIYKDRDTEPLGNYMKLMYDELPMVIFVSNDWPTVRTPYFRVYNNINESKATKVARLHFMDSNREYLNEYYEDMDVCDWIFTEEEINHIKEYLESPNYEYPEYTNWQWMCFSWNMLYNSFYDVCFIDEKGYFNGEYDKEPGFYTHQSYVPSTTKIPNTWNYNPPERKEKI